jgi:hypothetical protein
MEGRNPARRLWRNTGGACSCRQQPSRQVQFVAFHPVCHFLNIHKDAVSVLNPQTRLFQCLDSQTQPYGLGSVRTKTTTAKRQMMLTRIGSTISANEGTLAGDILWLATIAFVFSVVTGVVV